MVAMHPLFHHLNIPEPSLLLREAEAFSQAALDSLSAQICVVEKTGQIVAVNKSWKNFAASNGRRSQSDAIDIGANYLTVCEIAGAANSEGAAAFAEGLKAVIRNEQTDYCQEYDCHSPDQKRWFIGRVTRFSGTRALFVIVHENITERKEAELVLQRANESLEERVRERTRALVASNEALQREIDQRHRMEANLQRYRMLVEHSRDIVLFIRNKDGCILEANDAAMRAYGFTKDELQELTINDLRSPETLAQLKAQMETAATSGILFETRHCRKDGGTFSVEVSSSSIEINGEEILLSIVRDITERKRAEDLLVANEQKLRLLTEHTGDIIWTCDHAGRYTFVTPSIENMLGYTVEESMRHDLFHVSTPESGILIRNKIETISSKVLKGQRIDTESLELEHVRKNGATIPVEITLNGMYDGDGYFLGIVGVTRDITARKRAEAAVRESDNTLRSMLDAITESALLITPEGIILNANNKTAERFGIERSEFLGRNSFDLLPRDVAEGRKAQVERALSTGKQVLFEDERFGRYILNSICPVPDGNGMYTRLAVFGFDITARKEAELERERLVHELQRTLSELKTLRGIIPICSGCKMIRDNQGRWHPIEEYVHSHTQADFSHGLCPSCIKSLYPEFAD